MNELLSLLAAQLAEPLVTLVGLLLTIAIARAVEALRAKYRSELASSLLDRVDSLARGVVLDLEQTLVRELKASHHAADGKLEREEIKFIADKSLAKLRVMVGQRALNELKKTLGLDDGQVDVLLRSKIEQHVFKSKVVY